MTSASDRVAIVTGGASGIGRSVCELLARSGTRVAVFDLDGDAGREVATEFGGRYQYCDVSDPASVVNAVEITAEEFGVPTVLVNNAGWDQVGPFLDSDQDLWPKIVAINLLGPLYLARAVVPLMAGRGGGAIVNVASDAGRVGSSGEVVYSGAKGGIIAATKSLAREVARLGIRVNCVSPGPTDTPFFQRVSEENPGLMNALARSVPLGRIARPEEVASVIVFLADESASFVTGQTVSVSGGLTMNS